MDYDTFVEVAKEEGGLETFEVLNIFSNNDNLEEIKAAVRMAKERLFVTWASVDITDRDNEVIPIQDIINQQNILMERDGPITDAHTNKLVGKTLSFKIMTHPSGRHGVLHLNKIHGHNMRDDVVWTEIKNNKRTGSSVGGFNLSSRMERDPETGSMRKVLESFNQVETASVMRPSNPLALNEAVSVVAKGSSEVDKQENVGAPSDNPNLGADTEKPFAGFKDFPDCVAQNKDKTDPVAFCSYLQIQTEKACNDFKKKDGVIKEKNENNINKLNKRGDNQMEENVTKAEFSELTKTVSSLAKSVDALKEAMPEEKDKKKEVDLSGKDKPEDQRPEGENEEDTFKANVVKSFEGVAKSLEALNKKLDVKKADEEESKPEDEEKKKADEEESKPEDEKPEDKDAKKGSTPRPGAGKKSDSKLPTALDVAKGAKINWGQAHAINRGE